MRDVLFSILHDIGVPLILRRLRIENREIAVLMFHRISDESDLLWPPLPIKTFRSLARELSLKACVIPIENIGEVNEYPDRPLVALSFDDGYLDFWENAVPILNEFKLSANHNICPGLIDERLPPWTQILNNFLQCNPCEIVKLPNGDVYRARSGFRQSDFINICRVLNNIDNEARNSWIRQLLNRVPEEKITKLMNWNQIRECSKMGIHIGSHGMYHVNIAKIEDKDALLAEITESREEIYKKTGVKPKIFAFPKGSYNHQAVELVKKNDYRIVLLCDDMVSRFTGDVRRDFYIFPRINIVRANWKEENLRLLGFHQKLKSYIYGRPYLFTT